MKKKHSIISLGLLMFTLLISSIPIDSNAYNPNEYFKKPQAGEQNGGSDNLKSPLSAWKATKATLRRFSFDDPIDYRIRLEEMWIGEEANSLVNTENEFNDDPTTEQQWMVFKFSLGNINGKTLNASDVIRTYTGGTFYSSSGASIPIKDSATFSDELEGESVYDLKLENGASGVFYVGILIEKKYGFPYMKMNNGYDETEIFYWLNTSPGYEYNPTDDDDDDNSNTSGGDSGQSQNNQENTQPSPTPGNNTQPVEPTPPANDNTSDDDEPEIEVKTTKITKLAKGNKAFDAKWKKISGVNGYELQYSTSKFFSGKKTKTYKANITKATIKKLKAKKTYYVRMRCYKTVNGTKYYSDWCNTKKVKTK